MATKKTKADLTALFKLEFYRKQSNWKFCSQVHGKTKNETKVKSKPCATPAVGKPEDKCLNKTYYVEAAEEGERSVLNEAFMDPDNDKNISTPQNSPICLDKNWSPEFIKTSDKCSPLSHFDEVPNQNTLTSPEKPGDTNPERESPKHDILPNQNWVQNQEYRIVDQDCLEDKKMQNWASQTQDNCPAETNKRLENDQITHQDYNYLNWLQQAMTNYRQDCMTDKTNQVYQQNDINWPENSKVCPQQDHKIMQSWANIALNQPNQSKETYVEVNNNNPNLYTDWTAVEKLPKPIIGNWHNWKEMPQNALNIPQYSSDMPQYSSEISLNMPQISPNMPQLSSNMPQLSPNMPQISSNMPQISPYTPQNWVENILQNNIMWEECQGSDLPEMDKEGYEGTEAGWPLETQIWANNKLFPEAIWSDDVLRELELLNAQELDPEVPEAGEKWVKPDRLLQWMLANKECCDVLESSSESEEQFMRAAHNAPHSSVIDLQPQLNAVADTSEEYLELATVASEAVCALSESALRAVGRAHQWTLPRVADELRTRERQGSRSSSHPLPSPQHDISCEEYPTRDIGLHQPTFIDTFISGSYKNNPNYKNLDMQIDKEEVPKQSLEGPRIVVDRGQIRLSLSSGLEGQSGVHGSQFGLDRGQTGLDYGLEKGRGLNYDQGETGLNYRQNIQKSGQTVLDRDLQNIERGQAGLDWGQIGQTDLNRGQISLEYGQMGLNKDQKGPDFNLRGEMDLDPYLGIGENDFNRGQIRLVNCQIGLASGQPGSFGDHYLIGRGRGRLPIKDYQIMVGKGRGRI